MLAPAFCPVYAVLALLVALRSTFGTPIVDPASFQCNDGASLDDGSGAKHKEDTHSDKAAPSSGSSGADVWKLQAVARHSSRKILGVGTVPSAHLATMNVETALDRDLTQLRMRPVPAGIHVATLPTAPAEWSTSSPMRQRTSSDACL